MPQISGLTVRHSRRDDLQLPVELTIREDDRVQVRFSARSEALDEHLIAGTTTDISQGGLGFASRMFLPRMAEGIARVYAKARSRSQPDEQESRELLLEQRVKVRRVVMATHEPTYHIGVSFIDPPDDLHEVVEELRRQFGPTEDGAPDHA